jgi:hypothetical protein
MHQLTEKSLKGKLAYEEVRRLLIPPNLSQGDRAWTISMGFLHAAS